MEPLPDPIKDRVIKEVLAPPQLPLDKSKLYNKQGKLNYNVIKEHLVKEGKVNKKDLLELINNTIKVLKKEPNILKLKDPVIIVGDIHGQFYDLISLLELGGEPSSNQYLFMGDYVDRGSFSIEVLILLYAAKLTFPENIWLMRGNHECRQLTTFFNFKQECEIKYDIELYNAIMTSFDALPLGCIINSKFACVHGGISPNIDTFSAIDKLSRFVEIPKSGAICDLVWADPCEMDIDAVSTSYRDNSVRGCSYVFGLKAIKPFLVKNKFVSVFRAHEAQLEGFKMHKWEKSMSFPPVITIFSAPNYCDVYNNKGAILKLSNNTINLQQFNYSPHPYILPGFQNIFNWSIPFISEKISEMLYHITKAGELQLTGDENSESIIDENLSESLKLKVKFVTIMMKMFRTLREEKELILKLKGCCPGNKIPRGLILQGPMALRTAYERYNKAKVFDIINEKRPSNNDMNNVESYD